MLTHPMRQRLFFGAVLWFAIAVGSHASAAAQVIVWDGPGGDVAASPDYEVVVRRGSNHTPGR